MLHTDAVASRDWIADSTGTFENPALLIVSDCSLLRSGLAAALTGWPFRTVEATESADAARLSGMPWDILLFDVPSGANADEALRQVVHFPGIPCVVVADSFSFAAYAASLRVKASGFLMQDMSIPAFQVALFLILNGNKLFPTQFALSCFATMHCCDAGARELTKNERRGRLAFSKQEVRILDFLVQGNSNKLIARRLGNTEATVKVQMKALLRKLRLQNRTQAAVWAVTNGFGAISAGSEDQPHTP